MKFELECDMLEGKFEIKPEPFLQQREPNLWMDSSVIHNIQESEDEVSENENPEPQNQTINEEKKDSTPENATDKDVTHRKNETNKVHIPYCIFNLSYVNHSYIPKGKVVAFAEKEKDEESEIFQVEEIKDQEEYRNWVPKGKEGYQYNQSQTLYAAQQK